MIDWGSIPDWINVLIALLAFVGFIAVERERLPFARNSLHQQTSGTRTELPTGNFPPQTSDIEENGIAFRAKLYSLILIAIVLGLALSPIYTGAFSSLMGLERGAFYSAQNLASLISAIALSTLFSAAYLRRSTRLASIFVHWIERLFISFVFFSLIQEFAYISSEYYSAEINGVLEGGSLVTKIDFDTSANVTLCILMFLLIGFPSTPVDWIIGPVRKWIRKRDSKSGASSF